MVPDNSCFANAIILFYYKSFLQASPIVTLKNMDPLKIIPLNEKYIDKVFKNARKTSKKDKF